MDKVPGDWNTLLLLHF